MELAWQAQDGHHGQHQLNSKTFRQPPRCKQLLVLAVFPHGLRDAVQTVEYAEYREQANGYESQQLDQGFEGDGPHQAAVMFGGIQVAGTEYHGKHSQCQCKVQR